MLHDVTARADVGAQRGLPGHWPSYGGRGGPAGPEAGDHQVHRLRLVLHRSRPAVADQVAAALALARLTGWDQILSEQHAYLDDFWAGADVEVTGDPEIQQACGSRFPAAVRGPAGAAGRGQGADRPRLRRAHVLGYRDVRTALLTYTQPTGAADVAALASLGAAAGPGTRLRPGLGGRVPVADDRGQDAPGTGRPPLRSNQRGHRDPVISYIHATGDDKFELRWRRGTGGDRPAVAQPRPPRRRGPVPHRRRDRPAISAVKDNNVFTNLMAQRELWAAADWPRSTDVARSLDVSTEEAAEWRDAANP